MITTQLERFSEQCSGTVNTVSTYTYIKANSLESGLNYSFKYIILVITKNPSLQAAEASVEKRSDRRLSEVGRNASDSPCAKEQVVSRTARAPRGSVPAAPKQRA